MVILACPLCQDSCRVYFVGKSNDRVRQESEGNELRAVVRAQVMRCSEAAATVSPATAKRRALTKSTQEANQ